MRLSGEVVRVRAKVSDAPLVSEAFYRSTGDRSQG